MFSELLNFKVYSENVWYLIIDIKNVPKLPQRDSAVEVVEVAGVSGGAC